MESEVLPKNRHEGNRRDSFDNSVWSHFGHKNQEDSVRTEGGSLEMQREEALGLSYEFEHKMMR